MHKLLVINPNSSPHMTKEILKTIRGEKLTNLQIDVVKIDDAPEVLESFYDYSCAQMNVINYLKRNNIMNQGYDGVLLACFGDPGLFALKEMLNIPVIGIAEASMSISLLLGFKFSIVAAVRKAKFMMEYLVRTYGLESRLASVEVLDIDIRTFIKNEKQLIDAVKNCGLNAIAKGADILILGCAGMTILDIKEIQKELGITVIDPIIAGIYMLYSIINGRFDISRSGLYKR